MLGDLHLTFAETAAAEDYRRELDLDDAVAPASVIRIGDVKFVLAKRFPPLQIRSSSTRITCGQARQSQVSRAKLSRPECATVKRAGENELVMSGQLFEP